MRARANKLLFVIGFLLNFAAYAQQTLNLTQIAKIDLKEHPDSFRLFSGSDEDHGRNGPLFSIVTMPDGGLAALVAKQSGPWHLILVSNWATQKPVLKRLNVPGYDAGASDGFSIAPQILTTRDVRYLVTVARDPWPQAGDATVNVIDLQTFKLSTTQSASRYGLQGDWQMGPESSLLVHGKTSDRTKPPGSEQWLDLLSLPSLRVEDKCEYSVVFNAPGAVPATRAELHGTPSSMCSHEADNLVAKQNSSNELQQLNASLKPACVIESISPNHDYAVGTCRDCRRTLLGVSCKSEKSEIYDIDTGQTVASLMHAPHELTRVLVATSHEAQYLLAVENAEKLIVYKIQSAP